MFGRRKRQEEAAAEAAREAERRALFAQLAERPEHICPFLGLADDRAGYIEGVSDDHRCYAFGDPAPLSAEQQTRVCQERGYGNCPRYLRGVLVIPTEELEALRRPRAAGPLQPLPPPVPPPPAARRRRRLAAPIVLILLLLLLVGGATAGYLFLGGGLGPVAEGSATPSPTAEPTSEATPESSGALPGSGLASPTPEPTPSAGDTFAFYEVAVGPEDYLLFELDENGVVTDTRETPFDGFSYARAIPRIASGGEVYWETADGDLEGWSYTWPDSGNFRIRAVFRSTDGERRSAYLRQDELTVFPESTPAP